MSLVLLSCTLIFYSLPQTHNASAILASFLFFKYENPVLDFGFLYSWPRTPSVDFLMVNTFLNHPILRFNASSSEMTLLMILHKFVPHPVILQTSLY